MTDGNLMDADCIHGNTWWECPTCDEEMRNDPAISALVAPTPETKDKPPL